MKEEKLIHEGLIVESFPNGMFRVRLDNENLILGYVSGRIRRSFIRILPGDRVKIEVSRYDSSSGRIISRLRNVIRIKPIKLFFNFYTPEYNLRLKISRKLFSSNK
uniref:translation initiation factor 1 n=1 Tax=Koenigia cyanandra TaxID=374745 RepID=UPI0021CC4F05|nr:translation initiation factor 1 [Koenigia cyanandra]UWM11294.1 translation initiation factor 1 [Koenigia cyanandra]UWM11379.1 translation initiation factor 1 [Koenigia cyanandra]